MWDTLCVEVTSVLWCRYDYVPYWNREENLTRLPLTVNYRPIPHFPVQKYIYCCCKHLYIRVTPVHYSLCFWLNTVDNFLNANNPIVHRFDGFKINEAIKNDSKMIQRLQCSFCNDRYRVELCLIRISSLIPL